MLRKQGIIKRSLHVRIMTIYNDIRCTGTIAKEMEEKAGYDRVKTPSVTKEDLFLRSGHLPYYAESMYPPMELEGVKYNELPNAPQDLRFKGAFLPRPARAPCRIWHVLPLRKIG
jgi:hypothetical protein